MATHHVRHQSHPSKKSQPAHARPSRPLTKRAHSLGSKAAAAAAASKSAPYPKPDDDNNNNINDDDDSMAVSFLNYCTVCEKQIIVPSNSVLYCSESCKKKDSEKSLTYSFDHYSPPTTPFTNFSFDDFAFRDIVPQRSPTQPESKRSSCAFSDMSSDDYSSEHYVRSNSEASNYLRKFQSSIYSSEAAARPYRPRYQRSSTSQFSFSAAPSLSHTPASSVSYSLPYTPATTRPLPPRTKPSHSSSYGAKSIDLVTPVTAPSSPNNSSPKKSYSHKSSPAMSSTSTSTIEGEIVYAKSPVPEPSFASGSLGRLLASTPR